MEEIWHLIFWRIHDSIVSIGNCNKTIIVSSTMRCTRFETCHAVQWVNWIWKSSKHLRLYHPKADTPFSWNHGMALHGTFLGTAAGRFARVFPQGPQLCGARSADPLYSACGGPLWIQPKQGYAATCPQGPEKEGTATWRHGLAWRSTTLCLELISGGWPDDWSQHCADGSIHIYIHVWKFTDRWQRGNSFPALLPVGFAHSCSCWL